MNMCSCCKNVTCYCCNRNYSTPIANKVY